MTAPHLRQLCRWLGSTQKQKAFNTLTRYVLTESSRYCPNEDHGGYGAPGFNWQNPFTAYNCTWGFRAPAEYPEQRSCGANDPGTMGFGVTGSATPPVGPTLEERTNSTTCPRQMLCDHNVNPDGRVTREITRCNIEGYDPNPYPLTLALTLTLTLILTLTLTRTLPLTLNPTLTRTLPLTLAPTP